MLTQREPRMFLVSAVIHLIAIILLAWSATAVARPKIVKHDSVFLVSPAQKKRLAIRRPAVHAPISALPINEPAPIPALAVHEPLLAPGPTLAANEPPPIPALAIHAPVLAPAPTPPQIALPIRAAGFDTTASSPSAARKTTQTPQTSGFGDSQLSAAAKGAGSISQGGFGEDAQSTLPARRSGQPTSGSFGQILAAAPPVARTSPPPVTPPSSPVDITYKPRPVYTREARDLQIEGEVLLNVIFSSSGEVEVVRVLRGIGHGLDESAAAAARAIRFRPASRDGKPINMAGVVHIRFELAY